MADAADKDHIYELPAAVAIALSAGRPELLKIFRSDVAEGRIKLSKKVQAELVSLLHGLLSDLLEAKEGLRRAEGALDAIRDKTAEMRKDIVRVELAAVNRNAAALAEEDEG